MLRERPCRDNNRGPFQLLEELYSDACRFRDNDHRRGAAAGYRNEAGYGACRAARRCARPAAGAADADHRADAVHGRVEDRDARHRVVRTQSSDSLTRAHAAKRLGGLCGSGRSFIVSGRPKMQPAAYADSVRILAKQLTVRLDSLSTAMTTCEKTAGRDPATVTTTLTTRLKTYDDALLAFRNAQAALYKPDSTKTVSQQ